MLDNSQKMAFYYIANLLSKLTDGNIEQTPANPAAHKQFLLDIEAPALGDESTLNGFGTPHPDYRTPEKMLKEINNHFVANTYHKATEGELGAYTLFQGLIELRAVVVDEANSLYDSSFTPDQVLISHGTTSLYAALLKMFANRSEDKSVDALTQSIIDAATNCLNAEGLTEEEISKKTNQIKINSNPPLIVYHTPFYAMYDVAQQNMHGVKDIKIDTSAEGSKEQQEQYLLNELRTLCENHPNQDVVFNLIMPNNPDGRVYSADFINQLYQLLKEHKNLNVIQDTAYEFLMDTDPPCLLKMAMEDEDETVASRVFHLKTFSKEYTLSGFRIGALITAKNNIVSTQGVLSAKAALAPDFTQHGTPVLEKQLLAAVVCAVMSMDDGAIKKKYLELYRESVNQNLSYVREEMNRIEGVEAELPDSGMYLFVKIPEDINVASMVAALGQQNISISNGAIMGVEQTIRINAAVPLSELRTIMEAIHQHARDKRVSVEPSRSQEAQSILDNPFDMGRFKQLADDRPISNLAFLKVALFLNAKERTPRDMQEVDAFIEESAQIYDDFLLQEYREHHDIWGDWKAGSNSR